MKYDQFGQSYTTTEELCELIYKDPTLDLTNFLVEDWDRFNTSVKLTYSDIPSVKEYHPLPPETDIGAFHRMQQSCWHMPKEYIDLDIAAYILGLCKSEAELQRAGEELLLFQERDLFNLLRYMKYLVDTLRTNKIVWGVGRGSSVASYVLYLLGVHKIDSLYYDIDISEFLK